MYRYVHDNNKQNKFQDYPKIAIEISTQNLIRKGDDRTSADVVVSIKAREIDQIPRWYKQNLSHYPLA